MTHSIKAVLFDLDGTLIDTAPDFYTIMKELCENHQQTVLTYEEVRETVSHGARALVKRAFNLEENHTRFPALREELLQRYEKHLAVDTCLFEGLDDLLAELDKRHIIWGIVTNKPRQYAVPVLEGLNLHTRCATLVCPDDVSKTKPDPEPLFLACQQIDIAPEHCIYVGDHLRDIQAGNAAGMLSITAGFGYIDKTGQPKTWQADFYCETPQALADKVLTLI